MSPKWLPTPLPCNRDAYDAFIFAMSSRQRNPMTGQRTDFDWAPLIERLKVRGLWGPEIESKLTKMETTMRQIEIDIAGRPDGTDA